MEGHPGRPTWRSFGKSESSDRHRTCLQMDQRGHCSPGKSKQELGHACVLQEMGSASPRSPEVGNGGRASQQEAQ